MELVFAFLFLGLFAAGLYLLFKPRATISTPPSLQANLAIEKLLRSLAEKEADMYRRCFYLLLPEDSKDRGVQ